VKRGERRAREEFWEVWELRYYIPPLETTEAGLRNWWYQSPRPAPRTYSELTKILDEKRPLPCGESWSEGVVKEQIRAFRAFVQSTSGSAQFIHALENRDVSSVVRLLQLKGGEEVIRMHPYLLALRFLMSHAAEMPQQSIADILESADLRRLLGRRV
jgi:hypothetical protein